MSTNENTSSDLPEEQMAQMLEDILAVLLPPSADGSIPGAAGTGFPAFIRGESDDAPIREGLIRLAAEARNSHGKAFSALSRAEQAKLIDHLKVKDFRFFGTLSNQAIKYYYQNKDVVAALGLPSRPPFPLGHDVYDGDLTLLEPVYERGRKYRE